MEQILVVFPKEIEEILGKNAEKEIKILVAIKLWEDGKISLGKAAEIAGLTKEDFIAILSLRGISVIKEEVVKEDIETVRKL